jgi:hypothetical protein
VGGNGVTGVGVGGGDVGVGESTGVTGVGDAGGVSVGVEIGVSLTSGVGVGEIGEALASGVGVGEVVSSGDTRAVDFLDELSVGVGADVDFTASVDGAVGLEGSSGDGVSIRAG